jgi:long-chain fatty acid transport protein
MMREPGARLRRRPTRTRRMTLVTDLSLSSIVMLLLTNTAAASGFAIAAQSGSELGNAFAAQAAADDPATVWYNPAGMLGLDGTRISLVTNAVRPSFKFENGASTGVFARPAGNGGDGGSVSLVPELYVLSAPNERLRAGLSVNAPFGLKTDYESGWRGALLALKSEVKSYNVNPAIAYRMTDSVWLGAGIDWQHFTADLTNFAGPAGTAGLKASDSSWGYNLGALWQLPGEARAGLAFRSKISYRLEGNARFSAGGGALDSGVRAGLTVPESLAANVFIPLGRKWDCSADATWTRWSRLQQLTVLRTTPSLLGAAGSTVTTLPFDWRNAVLIALGTSYRVSESWKLKMGIAHDPAVSNDANRTPRLPDQARTLLTFGAAWRLSAKNSVDIAYGHDFVSNAAINNSIPGAGTLVGTFKDTADAISLQFNHRL